MGREFPVVPAALSGDVKILVEDSRIADTWRGWRLVHELGGLTPSNAWPKLATMSFLMRNLWSPRPGMKPNGNGSSSLRRGSGMPTPAAGLRFPLDLGFVALSLRVQ